MPRIIDYTPAALRDLVTAVAWFSQPGSGRRAQRRMQRIRAAIDGLAEHPCRYATRDHPGRREFSCEGYRIVYRVVPDTGRNDTAGKVQILRVFGPGQAR